METVSNITSAATRAIWGDTTQTNETAGQEPVSGEVGNTADGEPYDAGNAEPTSTSASKTTDLESSKPDSTSTSIPQTSTPAGNTPATSAIRPEHDTDKTGVTSMHNPTSATSSDKPTSSNDTSGPGATPSVSADPASGTAPSQKQQGADRPDETPSSAESDRIAATKKEADEAANVDTTGPGPVPLEQKAKEGGGKVGKGEGEDDGIQKESTGEGTGEQYVKSSGMVADGGDFDASNPGAGREADRLLEEKGVKRAEAPPKDTPGPSTAAADKKTATPDTEETKKKSLKEKIKEKLHKH